MFAVIDFINTIGLGAAIWALHGYELDKDAIRREEIRKLMDILKEGPIPPSPRWVHISVGSYKSILEGDT